MPQSLRTHLSFANVTSLLALVVALGAGTYAVGAIPGKDGRITACYERKGGELRIINGEKKKAKCAKGERKIVWSQQGPEGPPGRAGSPDAPGDLLAKLISVDGPGSGLDADTLGGAGPDGFLRSQRVLHGRASAGENGTLLLSFAAMGLEVRTHDPGAGDSVFHVRIRNTDAPGGRKLYVLLPSSATPIPGGGSVRFGGLTGLPDALVIESGGQGRMMKLGCFANVIAAGDDGFMQCLAVSVGPLG